MNRTYYQYIEITDFGPYITKLILCLPCEVRAQDLRKEQFCVYTQVLDMEGRQVELPENFLLRDRFVQSRGYRTILDVYPSDNEGNWQDAGTFATLAMAYGPRYACSSALAADFTDINGHESYVDSVNTITQVQEIPTESGPLTGMIFDHCAKVINHEPEKWLQDVSHDPECPLRYGYFVPRMGTGKRPLIVWLHGAGEGGADTKISYSGNKVTAMAGEEIQKKFGGCYLFSPQCPTMWLNDGSGTYGDSGQSIYGKPLKAAIDEFIEKNAYGIDTDRIYIGGDSNGGFMTMRMILDYPEFFAAAFPICEALLDARISDEDIRNIRDLPIWFTHAKDDPVVPPKKYVVPTYERLIAAGAKNVHFTFWDGIYDMHGQFLDEKGNPWHYLGHFAWIPVFNDDCRLDYDGKPVTVEGREVTLFDWLALQKRA